MAMRHDAANRSPRAGRSTSAAAATAAAPSSRSRTAGKGSRCRYGETAAGCRSPRPTSTPRKPITLSQPCVSAPTCQPLAAAKTAAMRLSPLAAQREKPGNALQGLALSPRSSRADGLIAPRPAGRDEGRRCDRHGTQVGMPFAPTEQRRPLGQLRPRHGACGIASARTCGLPAADGEPRRRRRRIAEQTGLRRRSRSRRDRA